MFFVSEHTTMFFINFYRSTKSMLERYIFFVTGRQVGLVVKTGPIFLYIVLLIRWWRRGDADEGKRTFQPISFDE